ncbi:hypothetical protein CLV62_101465 [Dysgonomonas alginatilytica]|uniref:Lipocalin-like protein n=1 Tax=Dysgonomonas alginatilytica TaxID=1605892 RepID=A0A2V3PWA2_9BACT|nr:membrane lipoprotein lipid attachment site-containing protein [Dysgonomonas alginatilytica]PXV69196.1 hypothetical protein CLV62_101465 [Dysgonomonas alginatilytica]
MKKILYLLLTAFTLTACGGGDDPDPTDPTDPTSKFDNWNDPASSHYTDGKYNTLKGEWQLTQRNGANASDFLVYKFDSNFKLWEATTEPAEEKDPTYGTSKTYITNDKEYKIANTVYQYAIAGTLESARLTIKDGNTTLTFKPYESKVWSWKGDWNSKTDPHYATYNGKYNPIKGTWKMTYVGGVPADTEYYRFNDDFTVERSPNGENRFESKRKYWINDTGVKEDAFNIHLSYTYSYKIEGNVLYYRTMLPKPSSGMTFVRYK